MTESNAVVVGHAIVVFAIALMDGRAIAANVVLAMNCASLLAQRMCVRIMDIANVDTAGSLQFRKTNFVIYIHI